MFIMPKYSSPQRWWNISGRFNSYYQRLFNAGFTIKSIYDIAMGAYETYQSYAGPRNPPRRFRRDDSVPAGPHDGALTVREEKKVSKGLAGGQRPRGAYLSKMPVPYGKESYRYGAMRVPRPLIYPFRRKLTVYRKVPLVLIQNSNTIKTETINGVAKGVAAIQVCAQPFSCPDTNGTVKYRNAVAGYHETSTTVYSALFPEAGGMDDLADVVDICTRYMSARVAGMRVELEFMPVAATAAGSYQTWSGTPTDLQIMTAFVANDTNALDVAGHTTEFTTSDKLMRLPGNKMFTYNPAQHYYQSIAGRANKPRYRLFSRKFPVVPGDDTVTAALASGATTNQAVQAGGWDHRAFYESGSSNAYETLQNAEYRAGKLHIVAKFPWAQLTASEGWSQVGTATLVGFLHTWHDVELKNDKNAFGPEPNP